MRHAAPKSPEGELESRLYFADAGRGQDARTARL